MFTNGLVGDNDRFLRLCWTNAGKLDAWRGTAKLYDLAGGIRAEQPIAKSGIKGAGAKVSAGYSGEASYRLVADIPSRFLVCVTYFDGVHFAKRSGRTIDLDLVSTTLMSWSELMMRRLYRRVIGGNGPQCGPLSLRGSPLSDTIHVAPEFIW